MKRALDYKLESHIIFSVTSTLIGLSFLTERYQLVSRALAAPFSLFDWVGVLSGQHVWGIGYLLFGVLALQPFNLYVRAGGLVGCTVGWSILCISSLVVALFGPEAPRVGSFAGLASMALLFSGLRSLQVLVPTWKRPSRQDHHQARD